MAVVGDPADEATRSLIDVARDAYPPHQVMAVAAADQAAESAVPLLHDRTLVDGLRPSVRRRLEGRLREKMSGLPAEDFVLRAKIVYATAERPG